MISFVALSLSSNSVSELYNYIGLIQLNVNDNDNSSYLLSTYNIPGTWLHTYLFDSQTLGVQYNKYVHFLAKKKWSLVRLNSQCMVTLWNVAEI